jgi:hypothetical protein
VSIDFRDAGMYPITINMSVKAVPEVFRSFVSEIIKKKQVSLNITQMQMQLKG